MMSLIEKTHDSKVMKTIVRIVGEWVRNKPQPPTLSNLNASPNLKEKGVLLVKIQQCIEKKFGDNTELMTIYLNIIHFIYQDDALRATELASKLEVSFLLGLRSTQPTLRNKFFSVFTRSIPDDLNSRLLYIICSQNWEHIGTYFLDKAMYSTYTRDS